MNLAYLVLGFLVLGSALGLALDDNPPIFRFSYELVNMQGMGRPGRVYG